MTMKIENFVDSLGRPLPKEIKDAQSLGALAAVAERQGKLTVAVGF